jgi:hypothetical protein
VVLLWIGCKRKLSATAIAAEGKRVPLPQNDPTHKGEPERCYRKNRSQGVKLKSIEKIKFLKEQYIFPHIILPPQIHFNHCFAFLSYNFISFFQKK